VVEEPGGDGLDDIGAGLALDVEDDGFAAIVPGADAIILDAGDHGAWVHRRDEIDTGGGRRIIESTLSHLADAGGARGGYVLALRDVTSAEDHLLLSRAEFGDFDRPGGVSLPVTRIARHSARELVTSLSRIMSSRSFKFQVHGAA
jgi:hypothetical protein